MQAAAQYSIVGTGRKVPRTLTATFVAREWRSVLGRLRSQRAFTEDAYGLWSASLNKSTRRVTVYTTSWCPDCRVAKRYLDTKGVTYEEVNIERTPGAAERVEAWSGGYRTVPTFDIDGTVVVDFDRHALDRALAL